MGGKKAYTQILCLMQIFSKVALLMSDAEIVYPIRHHNERSQNDLSTSKQDGIHEEYVTYEVKSKKTHYVMDLKKADKVHQGFIWLKSKKNGKEVAVKHYPEHCYYEGKVRGVKDSYAFISTCSGGLTGTIDDSKARYDIIPQRNGVGHYFRNVDHLVKKTLKQLKASSFYKDDKSHKITKRSFSSSDGPIELVNVEPQYLPYITRNQTRFVEMFVSCDHRMLPTYNNSRSLLIERVLNAYAQVDKAYQAINVRLVVVAIDIQENKPSFQRFSMGGEELSSFRNYVNNVIRKTSSFKDVDFDDAMFVSHEGWSDCAGMAWVNAMCGGNANSVNAWDYDSISGPTVVLGHEFGHNMGFNHDADTCKCLTPRGCFMGGSKSSRPGFSDCNMDEFKKNEYPCLSDYPTAPLTKVCGNGIREGDEECDCGTSEMCERNGDKCCEPSYCVLKAYAQCSYSNNPECCSPSCLFKKQGTLCREAVSECDLPEYCEGDKATCPVDKTFRNGIPCGNSIKFLLGPIGDSSSSISRLSPPIVAQYLKVLPKQWGVGDSACFKLDVRGCPAVQDYVFLPTSITSADLYYHSPFCITPSITSCSANVPDGTVLKYIDRDTHSGHCEHDYMKFLFAADGTLTHQCSGKKVCIDAKDFLVLQTNCVGETPRFNRTKENSLQHIQSKKCVSCTASGGRWPTHDTAAGLDSSCVSTYDRKVIIINILDCDVPLGMSNKALPGSAYTASSVYSKKYIPSNVVPYSQGWCPKVDIGSWFQINFGKVVRIATVEMFSTYWDRVTGYSLQYSSNNITWFDYLESNANATKQLESYCFSGSCTPSLINQCRKLWESDTLVASDSCWNKLNTNGLGFGTCSSTKNTSCLSSNVKCGQLQCNAKQETPRRVPDFGKSYAKLLVEGQNCSGASITESVQVGLGMVLEGSKCGENKFCFNRECKTAEEHGFKQCPVANGLECSGNGRCASGGTCLCNSGYNPADNCRSKLNPVDGGWSSWSAFTKCSKGCNGGIQKRYRFCSNPVAKYGGRECNGLSVEESACNNVTCPVAESCLAIKNLLEKQGLPLYDGQYTIKPTPSLTLAVYCDMKRDGGGWTLVVSSHSNSWDDKNVWLRNIDKPNLYEDYSIFKYADQLKASYKIKESTFYYRLEANQLGRWGGVFSAPAKYNISSTSSAQESVTLVKKFDDWEFGSYSIGQRLPYVSGYTITTSNQVSSDYWDSWGSLTDNQPGLYPSKWVRGQFKMEYPEHVWYWIREGAYSVPESCLSIFFRGLLGPKKFPSGIYDIEPAQNSVVKTYCDFERYGGGWTLLANIVTRNWSLDKIRYSPTDQVTEKDFSIVGLLESMKLKDRSEKSYQIMLEANSKDSNGGIFSIPVEYDSFSCSKSYAPTLLTKFGNWDPTIENIAKYPLCIAANRGFVISANSMKVGDDYGIIAGSGKYMTTLENPTLIRLWIREGGSRYSCNDLRVRGLVNGQSYNDGLYMLADNQPVYCDMTSTVNEAWTLIVASVSGGWTSDQVYARNTGSPSLFENFSILSKANAIKSLSKNRTFKYMLEGQARGRWGGIWQSSTSYIFNATSCQSSTIIKQFDSWDNGSWWIGAYPCLPYLSTDSKKNGLLITSTPDYGGVIISRNANDLPARWIYYQNDNPGAIWYWLNENDCDSNYKPVDGGLSSWSQWTSCSAFCGTGKQFSRRFCNSPVPKCGGKECNSLVLSKEQVCTGSCFTTQIRPSGDIYCIEPETGGCNPADNTALVLRPLSSYCKTNFSSFVFNPKTGSLLHKCSGKPICSKNGNKAGSPMVVSSACAKSDSTNQIQRTLWQSIQLYNQCFDPSGGTLANGVKVGLWGGCDETLRKFLMPGLADGPVTVSFFNNVANLLALKNDKRYPDSPTISGFIDNFDLLPYGTGNSGIRMRAYFRAPESGVYLFMLSCDDVCELLFTKDATNHKSAVKIASCSDYTNRYQWNKYPEQESSAISLNVGVQYYLEVNLVNTGASGFAAVGVKLPSGDVLAPISYEYLSAKYQ